LSFFEKRGTYFQGEDGVCFVKSERADPGKSFSRKRKEENKNPHTRTRLYDLNTST
jgi:hypothetical protein